MDALGPKTPLSEASLPQDQDDDGGVYVARRWRTIFLVGVPAVTLVAGAVIALATTPSPALGLEWTVLALGMSVLAVYASLAFRRLRLRELGTRRQQVTAAHQALV